MRRNLVRDAVHDYAHAAKGEKETDRRDKKPAPRTVRDPIMQQSAEPGAMQEQKHKRRS
jgi:hypothetical protein